MRKMIRRAYYLLNRRRLERELEDEMAAHREMMEFSRRKSFGDTLQIREQIRDVWGWQWLDDLRQDFHHGVRSFVRDRRVTVSALLAITLAVGTATAVFSVVDRSLFRPLPYHDGDHLVTVGLVLPSFGPRDLMFAGAYRDWQFAQSALDLTFWAGVNPCDLGGDSPQRLVCAKAESTFLSTLGVRPLIGRNFTVEEDSVGGEPVALISFALWRSRFAADPSIVDKVILIDGQLTRVIGVLPASFETPDLEPTDLLVPRRLPRERSRNVEVRVIGRLKRHHTLESATAALDPLFQSFRTDFGAKIGDNFSKTMRLRIAKLRDQQVQQYRIGLWMLLGAVSAFVLIACANVGNLLLARSIARIQEFGIRTALGASRERLVRQMLTESVLLALVGGCGGCLLASWLLRLSITLSPDGALRLRDATLDGRVLAFALVLSLGTALLFGLAPSLHRLCTEVMAGARVIRRRPSWVGQAIVVGQISVSVVLLSAAGLLLMSLWRLQNAPLGFAGEQVITGSFTLPQYRYPDDVRQLEFFRRLEEQLNDMPGRVAAAVTDSLPPGDETRRSPVANKTGSEIVGSIRWRYVTPGYFEALRIPIKMGRSFTDADRNPGDQPIILSETMYRSQFGNANPIGTRAGGDAGSTWPRIVIGVAGDVRNNGLANPPDPEYYVVRKASREGIPGASDPAWWRRGTAIVRTTLNQQAASALLKSTLHELDPALPIRIESMDGQVDRLLDRPRFQSVILSLFASTGLILAGIGLYGLISFLVAERTREIGIRIALGATPRGVINMVISDAGRLTSAGLVIGTLGAAGVSCLLQTMLYEVKSLDFRAFLGATLALTIVALVATWIPARRASNIQPTVALREE